VAFQRAQLDFEPRMVVAVELSRSSSLYLTKIGGGDSVSAPGVATVRGGTSFWYV